MNITLTRQTIRVHNRANGQVIGKVHDTVDEFDKVSFGPFLPSEVVEQERAFCELLGVPMGGHMYEELPGKVVRTFVQITF